jgi:hypothetical protein
MVKRRCAVRDPAAVSAQSGVEVCCVCRLIEVAKLSSSWRHLTDDYLGNELT